MLGWNVPFERELIEQSSLFDLRMPHHDSLSCFSQRLNQRMSGVATADFFNTIEPFRSSPVKFYFNAQGDFLPCLGRAISHFDPCAAWVEMFRVSARDWRSFRLRVALVWPCRRH